MALYLVPKRDGRPIVIDKAVLFVGRHPDCDVILTKSRKVSRKHCCLAQVDHQFFIRDLGSMNGVSVNGDRIEGSAPVSVGDEIVIGDVPFELKADDRGRKQGARPKRQQAPVAKPVEPPADISQDFPVPIPDEEKSFVVEERQPRRDVTVDDSRDDVMPLPRPRLHYDDDDGSLPDM